MPVRRAVACLAGLALLVAGCSNSKTVAAKRPHTGDETASSVAGVQQITITTGNDLRFHPSTITVHPGRVRIVLDNTAQPGSGPPHDLQVTGLPIYAGLATAGEKTTAEFTAPAPGRYKFVCTLHVQQGQTGTLVVLSN
jgi:plastocyanin